MLGQIHDDILPYDMNINVTNERKRSKKALLTAQAHLVFKCFSSTEGHAQSWNVRY